jgi:hypothetical protein
VVNSPAARSAPTATDTWFVTGPTDTTIPGAYDVRSMDEFDTELGDTSTIRPSLDTFFRVGGARAIVAPAATVDDIPDGLGLFTPELGPGQVSSPSVTDADALAALLAHAADRDNNRFAVLDGLNSTDIAAIAVAAAALAGDTARYGEMWVPRAIGRGPAIGGTQMLPYSAVQAALYARNDNLGVPRSQPPMGEEFGTVGEPIIGLSQAGFTKAQRDTLDDAGVSLARIVDTQVASWSNRTLDISGDPRYSESSVTRVLMGLTAQLKVVGRRYEGKRIDGRRHLIAQFGSDIETVLRNAWAIDDLFGDTQDQAFTVDVGASVNTDATIQAQQLNARITLTVSPTAGPITIQLTQLIIGQA